MTDERRYREGEVEEILDLAVRGAPDGPGPAWEGGLTLRELQEIGWEAGIAPDRIAEAAATLESRRGLLPRRTFVGLPISVARTVELPRALTAGEWEVVVADLRDTFAATGQVGSQGAAREWSNGNLRVLLEPTDSGHRLRMSTLHGRAFAGSRFGVAGLLAALVLLAIVVPDILSASELTLRVLIRGLLPHLVLVGASGGLLAWSRSVLPGWALERENQMEQIGARARALAGEPLREELP